MSGFRHLSGDRRRGKLPEKSNFAQTCNLLSQYIKDKGSLRDLNLEIGGKIESLENIVKQGSFCHEFTSKDAAAPTDSAAAGQLTIFYSGGVLVFDDYPAEKAEELVAFAANGGGSGILSNTSWAKPSSGGAAETSTPGESQLPPRPGSRKAAGVGITSNTASGGAAEVPPVENRGSTLPEANDSDLPIARRSSLHRFLGKRKDRAAARGPYQLQEQPASSSKGDEHFDLNL
ncbi:hypothetical protein ABFS82_04G092100 [Erythranthe guttata]|uniref:Protein TIFY n=1 Tax=Erythranthe guttata TaxID=4155 RepID=A0A022S1Y9_ERYGU|nr:PREDICTED: protein TIFY 11B-like [Erythranthe guttata]EYU45898.1 hypothetical protein MIMGU_mgv1a013086mg [Erythranthe guttata]|eukprot:XP_012836524.1 PREDICTED: protein TIFY 11B-like [Erythranthe guttata]